MSFSFSSLIRLIVLLAIGSTMLAVGIARLDPTRSQWRLLRPARFANVNEFFLDATERAPRWLDAESGRVEAYPLSDDDVLEAASCAPWADEQGQTQVVGRWSSRTKDGPMSMSSDFGIARYSFPGGEMIDQISTETVPVAPPCWYPGIRARVIFAAGDGLLYRFAFEDCRGVGIAQHAEMPADRRPEPLIWRCTPPGAGDVFISDVTWPETPRLGGVLLVALRQQVVTPKGSKKFSRTQLWWLKLDEDGTQVIEAGRLIEPDVSGSRDLEDDERTPSVAVRADGRLLLAFLEQQPGQKGWELRVAPIGLDKEHRRPVVLESSVKQRGGRYLPARPCFSPDGRWISMVVGASAKNSQVERFSTAGL